MAVSSTSRGLGMSRAGRTSARPSNGRGIVDRRDRRRRPRLEFLEDRTVLSPTIYTVTSTGDSLSDPSTATSGDLRYCIGLADANTSNPSGSVIEFDPTVFSSAKTITLGSGLVLSNTSTPTTITGPSAALTISGGGSSSNFSVITVNASVTASISGVTINNGNVTVGFGGGIDNSGTLTLSNSTLSGNTATYGGGLENSGTGTATLSNDTITANSTSSTGGGIDNRGTINLSYVTISDNSAVFGSGLYNMSQATLNNDTITGNSDPSSTDSTGGGVFNDAGATATFTNVVISNNTDYTFGGGIINEGITTMTNVSIVGNASTEADGGGFFNFPQSTATLTNVTISGNTAYASGGGIANEAVLTLINSTGRREFGYLSHGVRWWHLRFRNGHHADERHHFRKLVGR